MGFSWTTFLAQIVNLFVLVWLLKRFLYQPIVDTIAKRQRYIEDKVKKAADAVICRAGAMTIAEMALLGKACILIPSPNVANNHQYENAKRLSDVGAAIMHEEKNLTPSALIESVQSILENEETAASLSSAVRAFAKPTASDDIYKDLLLLTSEEIRKLLKKD